MTTLSLPEADSFHSLPKSSATSVNSLKISIKPGPPEPITKVSEWYDTDGQRTFMKNVRNGDIVESRNSRTSHWGIAVRLRQPPSPNGKKQ